VAAAFHQILSIQWEKDKWEHARIMPYKSEREGGGVGGIICIPLERREQSQLNRLSVINRSVHRRGWGGNIDLKCNPREEGGTLLCHTMLPKRKEKEKDLFADCRLHRKGKANYIPAVKFSKVKGPAIHQGKKFISIERNVYKAKRKKESVFVLLGAKKEEEEKVNMGYRTLCKHSRVGGV